MKRSILGSCLTAVCLIALAPWAHAQSTYKLDEVGVPNPPDVYSYFFGDMNDKGEVVGGAYATEGFWPFLWRDGELTRLQALPWSGNSDASAYGINNRTQVVGEASENGHIGHRPFLWDDGDVRDIGALTNFPSVGAADINTLGVIVGDAQDTGRRAYVQFGSHVRMLEPLPSGPGYTTAVRINEVGLICGTAWTATGTHAVVWRRGHVRDLGVPANADSTTGLALNNFGDVVGESQAGEFSSVRRPIWWHRGQITELPLFASAQYEGGSATGINDAGLIVGVNLTLNGAIPMLWWNGQMYNLNDLVRADDPLRGVAQLQFAQAINNRGQILVQGTDANTHLVMLYRLTPSGHL
jgi:probable HAF family extracellular repeat protein